MTQKNVLYIFRNNIFQTKYNQNLLMNFENCAFKVEIFQIEWPLVRNGEILQGKKSKHPILMPISNLITFPPNLQCLRCLPSELFYSSRRPQETRDKLVWPSFFQTRGRRHPSNISIQPAPKR